MGLGWIGVGVTSALDAISPLTSEGTVIVLMGLMWLFGGTLLAVPTAAGRWRGPLAALLVHHLRWPLTGWPSPPGHAE